MLYLSKNKLVSAYVLVGHMITLNLRNNGNACMSVYKYYSYIKAEESSI